jgi:Transposase DDE domain
MALTDSQRLEAAVEASPVTTLALGVLSWVFPPGSFQTLFGEYAPNQWDRKLTINAITWLMLEVATGSRPSIHAAYQADVRSPNPTLEASDQALYQKYGRLEIKYSTAVVRASAQRCLLILASAMVAVPEIFGWEGYRIRVIDGTDLGGTEHRLGVLRKIRSAGLPGRFVVCYEPAIGLVTDVVASEDAYTSERVMVLDIINCGRANDLYVCDRFYCTADILFRLCDARAFFVIRHFDRIRVRVLKDLGDQGRVPTGSVSEQKIEVENTETGETRRMRLITLKLDTPTSDGDTEIRILTNLTGVNALKVCELYRTRWTIEGHFSFLKNELNGEIESLGRPRAAIFAMCMAMVAGNALAVVKRALIEEHGSDFWDRLSGYYLADELEKSSRAVDRLVGEAGWSDLAEKPAGAFWSWCKDVASKVEVRTFEKNKRRGPKKPKPKGLSGKRRPHYSTHRLLQGISQSKC